MSLLQLKKRRFGSFCLTLAFTAALPAFAVTLTVTNTNDSGAGSLRNAIATAHSGDTINFKLPNPSTITLTGGKLTISQNLTITGPGAAQLAIDGNKASQVFSINLGVTASISGLTIQNGEIPGAGGGIANSGSLTLTGCTVSHNVGGNEGGAIYNAGSLTVTDSSVSDNPNAYVDGGAIGNDGTLTLINSTIARNSASEGFGGGIANYGTATLTNSTVSGNSAYEGGGGILNEPAQGSLTLINSTVSGNSSNFEGSGILNLAPLTIKSTLFANNATAGNCDFYVPGGSTVTSLGYNLSDDGTCAFSGPGDENNVVAGAGLDPKGLQNNGGPTQTIALLSTSPAVDHIPVADCTDANGKPVTTDQRGVSRPQGKGCDVGAYELVQSVSFESFHPSLAIDDGKHPGFVLTSTFTLGSASAGLNPATEAMTLQIANYTLTLPAGSFHQLWKATNAPYGYEGTVSGATVAIGLVPLGNNTYSFDAAGSPVTFPGIKNPVTVTLTFGTDTGTASVQALITSF